MLTVPPGMCTGRDASIDATQLDRNGETISLFFLSSISGLSGNE